MEPKKCASVFSRVTGNKNTNDLKEKREKTLNVQEFEGKEQEKVKM